MRVFLAVIVILAFTSISIAIGVVGSILHPIAGIFFGVLFFVGTVCYRIASHKLWLSLPTVDQYLAQHRNCKSDRGISCFKCNSKSIRNFGITSAMDVMRIHICNHCNTKLYRSGKTIFIE